MFFKKLNKKIRSFFVGRGLMIGVLLLLQIAWINVLLFRILSYSVYISACLTVLSAVAVAYIINSNYNPSVKLAWVVPILIFPLFGGLLYLFVGGKRPQRKMRRALERADELTGPYVEPHVQLLDQVRKEDPHIAGQMAYMTDNRYPVYESTEAHYFPSGETCFEAMLDALKKAEHFILLEFFIVQEGKMWDSILEVLKEKAASGVEVRFIFDDMGSLFTLPSRYEKTMEAAGIKCLAFNPFVPFLSIVMNHRDHRKIMVIDGHTAFTGGINLADEYINETAPYGHWKDAAVMLCGEGAWSLTLMFLNMWNGFRPEDTDLEKFRPKENAPKFVGEGYVQPYADSPLDEEILAENVYINLISGATKYVYIYTPYLIMDHELSVALCLASKRGVDVRIMTPGIPDKKIIYQLTRSHYPELLDNGVKIYEYTPGFLHAKCVVSDDKLATVGTINFDYRSLYHHFECGTLHYKNKVVMQVKEDFLQTQQLCSRVTEYRTSRMPVRKTIYYAILRLFAPLV